MSLPDPSAGLHAAIGTIAALYRVRTARRRRRPRVLDARGVDQRVAVGVLTTSAEGRPPACRDRDERMARTARSLRPATYAWVAIAVATTSSSPRWPPRSAVPSWRPTRASPRGRPAGQRGRAGEDRRRLDVDRGPATPRSPRSWRPASRPRRSGRWTRSRRRRTSVSAASSSRSSTPRPATARSPVRRGTPSRHADAACARRRRLLGQHTDGCSATCSAWTTTRSSS